MKIFTYSKMSKPINLQAVVLKSKMVIVLASKYVSCPPQTSPAQLVPSLAEFTTVEKIEDCMVFASVFSDQKKHATSMFVWEMARRGTPRRTPAAPPPIFQMNNIMSLGSSSTTSKCVPHFSLFTYNNKPRSSLNSLTNFYYNIY